MSWAGTALARDHGCFSTDPASGGSARAVIGRMPEEPALGGVRGSVARWSDGWGSRAGQALDAREGWAARRRGTPRRRRRCRRGPAAAAHRRGRHRQDPAAAGAARTWPTARGSRCGARRRSPRTSSSPRACCWTSGHSMSRSDDPDVAARGRALVTTWARSPSRRPARATRTGGAGCSSSTPSERLAVLADDGPGAAGAGGPALVRRAEPGDRRAPRPPAALAAAAGGRHAAHRRAAPGPARSAPGGRGCCCSGWPRRSRCPGWTTSETARMVHELLPRARRVRRAGRARARSGRAACRCTSRSW